jgi:hypothetical protein
MNVRIILFPASICQLGRVSLLRGEARLRGLLRVFAIVGLASLAGCDYVGLQSTTQLEARLDAEGRAVGGACRHAGRALEDCYMLNTRVPKAPIFEGWREMNNYMIENKIDVVAPDLANKKRAADAIASAAAAAAAAKEAH